MALLQKKHRVEERRIVLIPPTQILPNPEQPRKHFDAKALAELAHSIRIHGILQPITVRRCNNGHYELIAGERRLRASIFSGLDVIPCFILDVSRQDSRELSLIENIQRKDLNFLEEAQALDRLIKVYGLSQEEIAAKIGTSQSSIINKLRILHLPSEIVSLLQTNGFTEYHARCLLRINSPHLQMQVAKTIISENMSIFKTEEFVTQLLYTQTKTSSPSPNEQRKTYIIRDVRFFLNSINHGLSIMKTAGIDAEYEQSEDTSYIQLNIRIPKATQSK